MASSKQGRGCVRERESAYGAVCVKRPGEEGIKGGKAGGKGEGERASDGLLYGQFARVLVQERGQVRGVSGKGMKHMI